MDNNEEKLTSETTSDDSNLTKDNVFSTDEELVQDKLESRMDKRASSSKGKKIFFAILIFLLFVLLAFGGVVYYKAHSLVSSYEQKVYPELYLEDINLSGLNKIELKNAVNDLLSQISSKNFLVTVDDQNFELSYFDINITADADAIVEEIYSYGKDEKFFKKLSLINDPATKEFTIKLEYDETLIDKFIDSISESVNREPSNATVDISSGSPIVTEGYNGRQFLNADCKKAIIANISTNLEEATIELVGKTDDILPEITAEKLNTIDSIIGSFTTYFSSGPSGTNIAKGASYVNNTLLMPGDIFSCEAAIGPTTEERGFVYANTYVAGKVVPGLGGGVCQIASTIYNAELRSGIIPLERLNHMMPVGYVGIGLDATLADDLIDLKFDNPYDYPIVIRSYTSGGALTVEFWSNKDAKGGITYEPYAVKHDSLNADTYLRATDQYGNVVMDEYIDSSKYDPPSW